MAVTITSPQAAAFCPLQLTLIHDQDDDPIKEDMDGESPYLIEPESRFEPEEFKLLAPERVEDLDIDDVDDESSFETELLRLEAEAVEDLDTESAVSLSSSGIVIILSTWWLLFFFGSGGKGKFLLLWSFLVGDSPFATPCELLEFRFKCDDPVIDGGSILFVPGHVIATETSLHGKYSWPRAVITDRFPMPMFRGSSVLHMKTWESSLALITYVPSDVNVAAIWLFVFLNPDIEKICSTYMIQLLDQPIFRSIWLNQLVWSYVYNHGKYN